MFDAHPFVSVIMPIRNEADFIAKSLGAVLIQDYPHERMEILIADGMSTDETRNLVCRMMTTTSIPIRIVDNPKQIVPAGFNSALQRAQGEIIVRVDGHCEIAPDYITKCVHYLRTKDVGGVGGPLETISPTLLGKAIALAMSSPFGVGGSSFRIVKDHAMFVDTIAFPAYTRSTMDNAGYLDEEFVRNQDDEYNYRLRSLGYKLLLHPDIKSKYYARNSLKKLWKQYYQYGFYKVRVTQKHPRQMRPRQFAPFALVLAVSVGGIASPFSAEIFWCWCCTCGLYAIANLTASYVASQRARNARIFALMPIVFAILHFSYGFGFLVGLVHFANRWQLKHTTLSAEGDVEDR